jgi:uncharacterized protein (TIGR02588 family)
MPNDTERRAPDRRPDDGQGDGQGDGRHQRPSEQPEGGQQAEHADESETQEAKSPPSWLEHVATTVSALLVLGLLAVLGWDATHADRPADFEVHAGRPRLVGHEYRVPISVTNHGDEAAKSVIVHVELRGTDTVFAETDLTLDWLPGRSMRELVGSFSQPVASHQPHAEVRGFEVP